MKGIDILIAGVGGQGTLFASRVLGHYAALAGYDCKLSEVHGMAQRGGSVVTYIRFGDKVYSPVIDEGGADIVLAFEFLEAARWRHYLKDGGTMIVNRQRIMPLPVITGAVKYPENLETKFDGVKIIYADAFEIAKKLGRPMVGNTVMLGALTKTLGLQVELMKKAIALSVKPEFFDANIEAFILGINAV